MPAVSLRPRPTAGTISSPRHPHWNPGTANVIPEQPGVGLDSEHGDTILRAFLIGLIHQSDAT